MNHPHALRLLTTKGWWPPTEAEHPHHTLGLLRGQEGINMQNHEPGDASHLLPSRQKKHICIKHFEQKFTQGKSLQQPLGPLHDLEQGMVPTTMCAQRYGAYPEWCVTLTSLLPTRRQLQDFFSLYLRMPAISTWHRAGLDDGLTYKSWVKDKINTYQCSPHSIHKCSPLLGSCTAHCSHRGWSSRGQSPSRSSRPWSLGGIGTAARWWGGWGGTGRCWSWWTGPSCQTSGRRHTSCSSHRARASRCCHRRAAPSVWKSWSAGSCWGRSAPAGPLRGRTCFECHQAAKPRRSHSGYWSWHLCHSGCWKRRCRPWRWRAPLPPPPRTGIGEEKGTSPGTCSPAAPWYCWWACRPWWWWRAGCRLLWHCGHHLKGREREITARSESRLQPTDKEVPTVSWK